ncbi:MAG: peptidase domain-containing ABC transporter [Pontibacterium sp.]
MSTLTNKVESADGTQHPISGDQVIEHKTTPEARQHHVLSEALSEALRTNSVADMPRLSPFAACLAPLLEALGWRDYAQDLISALPHFEDELELVDFRNIMVNLGYDSHVKPAAKALAKEELMPCLFVDDQGNPFILLKRDGFRVEAWSGKERQKITLTLGALNALAGRMFLFTQSKQAYAQTVSGDQGRSWFGGIYRRFKPAIGQLVAMTLLINLIAMVVPVFIMLVYDKVIGAESEAALPFMIIGVVLVLAADLVVRYFRGRMLGHLAGRMDYLIAVEAFKQIIALPTSMTERASISAQLTRLRQFDSLRDFCTGANASVLLDLPFIPLLMGLAALLAGWVSVVPVVAMIVLALFAMLWVPVGEAHIRHTGTAKNDKQRILIESLEGRQEIKGAAAETTWLERFREYSGESSQANYSAAAHSAVMGAVAQAVLMATMLAILVVGSYGVMEGTTTVGALIAVMVLVSRILSPAQQAFLSLSRLRQVFSSVRQLNQLMTLQTEKNTHAAPFDHEAVQGVVEFDRVTFRYGAQDDPALLGVAFVANAGQLTVVAGDTGSGKSTLAKLLSGLYRPQSGNIRLDGADIRQLNTQDLRKALAYVPQKTELFRGTIAQNIRLGNCLATDDDLREVCRMVGVWNDIERLPQGIDTVLGDERTSQLPPGFNYAISMARAFVSSAQIVLLDEPGSSLDHSGDRRLRRLLQALKGKKTVLLISHRPSHLRMADQVVVLNKGAVQHVGDAETALQVLVGGQPNGGQ